jgi:hypothetical protein
LHFFQGATTLSKFPWGKLDINFILHFPLEKHLSSLFDTPNVSHAFYMALIQWASVSASPLRKGVAGIGFHL